MKRFYRALWAMAALLALSCNELPSPPVGASSDAELQARGLQKDGDGIWRNPDLDNQPFADMPLAYREFWRYCFSCHSTSGQKSQARAARRALRIDSWAQVLAYGPEKLIFAVKTGGMPLAASPRVPPEVLDRAEAYLASWGRAVTQPELLGFRYAAAEDFVRLYCADCHAAGGTHSKQPTATRRLILDNYETWHRQQASIAARLDSANADDFIMPPVDYAHQPSPDDRRRMLRWIDSLSPNTRDGAGHGTPVTPAGALRGSRYDTATALVRKYCADCHTEGGFNPRQWDGWAAAQFDTYAQWKNFGAANVIARLSPDSAAAAGLDPMPPGDYSNQPDDGERAVLLEWLRRGSPNTPTGR